MINQEQRLIMKIKKLSDNYHKLSLLFYELSQSLEIQVKQGKRLKDLKEALKGFDFSRLKDFHFVEFSLNDLRRDKNEK